MHQVLTFLSGFVVFASVGTAAAQQCQAGGAFTESAPMTIQRGSHAAALLPTGSVLLAGNDQNSRHAEIFNPQTNAMTPTGALQVGRCYGCGVGTLTDGRVLIVGGWATSGPVLASVELFDPSPGAFATTGSMTDNRLGPNVHRLVDGRVIAFGGHTGFAPRASAEVFNPLTETWSPTGGMAMARLGESVVLADGAVLVVGGLTSGGGYLASAEIYDPSTAAFVPTGSMEAGRHAHSAISLNDGRVLVTGGYGGAQGNDHLLATAEIFDPATGQFLATGPLATARAGHKSARLGDGTILILGGTDAAQTPLASTEIYNPVTQTFSPGPPMTVGRNSPAVVTLNDGRVFVSGGYSFNGGRLASTELFEPCALDTTPPSLVLPADIIAEATSAVGATVTYAASAHDDVDGPVTATCLPSSGGLFAMGTTIVGCQAVDAAGNTANGTFTVTVLDTTPPVVSLLLPSTAVLWPPNHKMHTVTLTATANEATGPALCHVSSVISSEPDDAAGDGSTSPDWLVTGALSVQLRAERSAANRGRRYQLAVTCTDAAGNASTATTDVIVPRNQGR